MAIKESKSRKVFHVFNYIFLIFSAFICVFPIVHIFAVSLSVNTAVEAGIVKIWPVGFTLNPYEFILKEPRFFNSFWVTVKRTLMGITLNMILTVLAAYPMSKSVRDFRFRTIYVWYFLVTILFAGGLVPLYMVVRYTGLIDTIWALIIPTAVPVFNIILLQNFFKGIPEEIKESAYMDGAGHMRTLITIFLPLSKPALATLVLFATVGHWNAWFDGLIFMNRPENYPLQSYLQTVVVQRDLKATTIENIKAVKGVSERNSKAAQIFIAMLPILLVYPFLQKYFAKGIVLGSVKG